MSNDFDKICRVCMCKPMALIPIWDVYGPTTKTFTSLQQQSNEHSWIAMMLEKLTNFGVSFKDELPKNVCLVCVDKLKHVFSIKQECERSEATMRTNQTMIKTKASSSRYCGRSSTAQNEMVMERNLPMESGVIGDEQAIIKKEPTICQDDQMIYQCVKCSAEFKTALDVEHHQLLEHQQLSLPIQLIQSELLSKLFKCKLCLAEFNQLQSAEQLCKKHARVETSLALDAVLHSTIDEFAVKDQYEEYPIFVDVNDFEHHMISGNFPHRKIVCAPNNLFNSTESNGAAIASNKSELKITGVFCGNGKEIDFSNKQSVNDNLQMLKNSKKTSQSINHENLIASKVNDEIAMTKNWLESSKSNPNRQLYYRIQYKNGNRQFMCNCCGKYLKTKALILVHLLQHTGDRPFQCDICAKRFQTKGHIQTHLMRHVTSNQFDCTMCSSTFLNKATLRRHTKIHLANRLNKTSSSVRKTHCRSHTSESNPETTRILRSSLRKRKSLRLRLIK